MCDSYNALVYRTWTRIMNGSDAPVIVSMSIGVGGIILLESSLSFLGFGIQPPGASWGSMVTENLFQ